MEGLVFALFVLKDLRKSQRQTRVIAEPEFQPFNLAVLRLPRDIQDQSRGNTPNRQPALAAAC
jgi:hypothetical protein